MDKNLKISVMPIGEDLSKVTFNKSTGYFNSAPRIIDGQAVHVLVSKKQGLMWLVPVKEEKVAKTPRKAVKR